MKSNIVIISSLFIFCFVCVASSLTFVSCQSKSSKKFEKLEKMNWLIGSWEQELPEGTLVESWTKENDSLFTGKTCMIINNDTGFTEQITLKMIGTDVFYIPVVNGQNQNLPVSFKMVSGINGEFVFENLQHDFPQRIIYRNSKPDSLYARIEGNYNGEFRKEEFTLGRDKITAN